ncbi:MAG: PAS domain-containing protein [Gemmatimonadales bacterium]|nr:PAS domain-containing protein [Gemmatimonadales bacterium]
MNSSHEHSRATPPSVTLPQADIWRRIVGATTASATTLFAQDEELRYQWVLNPQHGFEELPLLRRTDAELWGRHEAATLVSLKRRVLESGHGEAFDFVGVAGGRVRRYRLALAPARDAAGRVVRVFGAATDLDAADGPDEGVALVALDLSGGLLFVDPEGERLLGQPLARLVGEQWWSVIHEADRAALAEVAGGRRDVPESFRRDFRIRGVTGERWLRFRAVVARDLDGEPLGFLATLQDDTEARRSYELFGAALRGSGMVLFAQDLDLRYIWILNAQLGLAADDVLGRTDTQLLGEPAGGLVRVKREVLASGKTRNEVVEVPGAAGSRWYDLWVAPLHDADGTLLGVSGAAVDVTALRDTSATLGQMRMLADAIDVGIFLSDMQGNVLYGNAALERIDGLRPEERMGHGWTRLVHPDDRVAFDRHRARLRSEGVPMDVEIREVVADGDVRWMRVRGHLLRDAAGRPFGVAGTKVDVTEDRRREAALRQHQKMEALGTLAGGIAHDFNNYLSAILGHAELLRLGEPDPEVAESARQIITAGQRARELVKRIMTFSRADSTGELVPVDVATLLRETELLLRPSLPPGLLLVVDVPATPVVVLGDPTQLSQALLNLVANAWHAMRGRVGSVRLAARATASGDGRASVHLEVRDEGPGMTPDVLQRCTEPYFTTKAPGEGTGLGLAMVHGVASACGGRLVIESEPGRGTTARLELPRHVVGVSPEPRDAAGRAPSGARGLRVLAVDDDTAVLDLTAAQCRRLGHVVTAFADPVAALAWVAEDPRRVDVVLVDGSMPGMTGLEVARLLQELRPGLPVVLCTGFVERLSADAALAQGLRAVLWKPVLLADLERCLAALEPANVRT